MPGETICNTIEFIMTILFSPKTNARKASIHFQHLRKILNGKPHALARETLGRSWRMRPQKPLIVRAGFLRTGFVDLERISLPAKLR